VLLHKIGSKKLKKEIKGYNKKMIVELFI